MCAAMTDVITDPEGLDYDVLPDLLGYQLRRAQLAVFQNFARRLQEYKITPTQFAVLILVSANPGLSQRALSEAVATDQSTLVSLLDRLEKRGWIERRRSPQDRRYQILNLTPDGETELQNLRRVVLEHDREFGNALSEDERGALMDLLRRFAGS